MAEGKLATELLIVTKFLPDDIITKGRPTLKGGLTNAQQIMLEKKSIKEPGNKVKFLSPEPSGVLSIQFLRVRNHG
jgi:hypothetical protein